jgi:transposase
MIKEVLRLHYSCSLSQKKISKALGCSHGTVGEYIHRAKAAGLTWPVPDEISDTQLEEKLYPPITKNRHRQLPDCIYIHNELKKKGVTLVQLWSEYKEDNPEGYELTQYCQHYRQFTKNLNIVMRQEHKAGEKAFSDFAGKTLQITNPNTGEVTKAHLFVCTLGASNFTFADLFWDESTESWCNGHAGAFSYFGGSTKILVPDNPKPVVTKACPYEPDINPSFAQMAAHYDVAVIPARVRKPKDKAKVEAAVGLATRWILAVLRNRKFFSLAEARAAVRELLEKLNDRPFKKIPGTRRSQFETIDKPDLKPLPMVPYEYAQYKNASVNIDYHIDFDSNFYSVPCQFRGEVVEVRATSTTVEVFRRGKRIASHSRSISVHKFITEKEHQPKNHQEYGDWSPERIINWACKIGSSTGVLIKTIMERQEIPEVGYRRCLGVLRLAKKYSNDRVESACTRALAIGGFTPKSVKSILDSNLDLRPLPEKNNQLSIVHANIRGANEFVPETTEEEEYADTPNNREYERVEAVWNGQSPPDANGTEGSSRAHL